MEYCLSFSQKQRNYSLNSILSFIIIELDQKFIDGFVPKAVARLKQVFIDNWAVNTLSVLFKADVQNVPITGNYLLAKMAEPPASNCPSPRSVRCLLVCYALTRGQSTPMYFDQTEFE